MDEKDLRAFITAAEDLSFSVAADKLHITQSAMSKRMANLEDSIGVKLFERQHNKLILTDLGRPLASRCQ